MKRFLFFTLITVLCFQLKAQSEFKPEWNFGVGIGTTFSNMSIVPTNDPNSIKTKSISQIKGGISVRYLVENHLGLIGEINYSQQGWKSEFPNNPEFEHKHQLNYLEIPLMTHIYFGSEKVRFFFNLGPQIGYLLSEKITRNEKLDSWLTNNPNSTDNAIESYRTLADKKIDYGITVGTGLELRSKFGNFALDGRYYMGFGDIYNNKKKDNYSRSANRVLNVRLTYFTNIFK